MNVARRPGQPITALGIVLGAWVIARIVLWQGPLPVGEALAMSDRLPPPAVAGKADPRVAAEGAPSKMMRASPSADPPVAKGGLPELRRLATRNVGPSQRTDAGYGKPLAPVAAAVAAMSHPEEQPLTPLGPTGFIRERRAPIAPALSRWSGGGWLLLRGGAAGGLAAGPGVGRYGGSQAGAVVSYSLGGSNRRPALYARSTAALRGAADRELALGASARPLAAIPVRAQLELRARESEGGVRFAPAALAVSELPPLSLPARFRAEAYLQAGYVGGEFATPFVGGDLRIDRPVLAVRSARLRAGAGAWGGAQEGAGALDVGPGVTLESELGGIPARLALDYRLRVAGSAEPRSGLALTLSTGF